MNWLKSMFDTSSYMPHGYCLVWNPGLIWLHVVSDALIGLAYYSIPLALVYFVMRRRDIAFSWVFFLFAAFILLCGATHFIEILTLWRPDYGMQGVVKAVTAVVSVGTAIVLWPIMPRAIALPSPAQLRLANDRLSREVEERSKAVEALSREREFTQLLINSTSECMAVIDSDLIVRLWNPALAAYTGVPADRTLGLPIFEARPPLRGTAFETAIREALTGRDLALEDEIVTYGGPDAPTRWIDARYSSIRNGKGEVVGCLVCVRDVTDRHEMERTLRHAQKMEAVGQLSGGVAHDFNNLLTVVGGSLDLILSNLADAERVEQHASRALGAVVRCERLIKQLLMFGRRQPLHPKTVDLNRLIADFDTLIRQVVGANIDFEMHLAPALDHARIDRPQFEAAMLNLVMNARDAISGPGRIVIETSNVELRPDHAVGDREAPPGSYVMVRLSDTGQGISPDTLPRVFDPFFTTKEVGRGSGLGLSQVYGFAKESGGHVEIDSEVGVGTIVRLYLPRSLEQEIGAEPTGDQAPLNRVSDGKTVLVVEDDQPVRHIAVECLIQLGYRVLTAQNAESALEILKTDTVIDILFSDVVMPGKMNGVELSVEARRMRPAVKVLLTSGYADNELADNHGLEETVPLLPKPYRPRDLAAQFGAINREK